MWYEAIPSMLAMGAAMSLIEISPFVSNYLFVLVLQFSFLVIWLLITNITLIQVTHYISWGCPMQRASYGGMQDRLTVRDQRVAESHGVTKTALHMHTFGLGVLKEPVKMSGNCDNYKEAEKAFLAKLA